MEVVAVNVLHGVSEEASVVDEIFGTVHPTTRLDHHSVSVPAIKTNPLFAIPHFVIGVYPYCPSVIGVPATKNPEKLLLEFGSVGTLDMPAEINLSLMPLKAHAVSGKLP